MTNEAVTMLRAAKLYSDGRKYILVRFPPQATIVAAAILSEIAAPFSTVIVDKDEITLIMPQDLVSEFSQRIKQDSVSSEVYQLLTFDIELELTLVGFMAEVSRILADENISILPIAAFSRDHLLIPAHQFEQAIAALNKSRGL